MILNIILVTVVLILIFKYSDIIKALNKSKEEFDIKYVDEPINKLPTLKKDIYNVVPNGSVFLPDNIAFHEQITQNCKDSECDRIDNYRHKFFEFNDRINQTTHLIDPVDNINATNKAQDYLLGGKISDIYDDLVNSNKYKT